MICRRSSSATSIHAHARRSAQDPRLSRASLLRRETCRPSSAVNRKALDRGSATKMTTSRSRLYKRAAYQISIITTLLARSAMLQPHTLLRRKAPPQVCVHKSRPHRTSQREQATTVKSLSFCKLDKVPRRKLQPKSRGTKIRRVASVATRQALLARHRTMRAMTPSTGATTRRRRLHSAL